MGDEIKSCTNALMSRAHMGATGGKVYFLIEASSRHRYHLLSEASWALVISRCKHSHLLSSFTHKHIYLRLPLPGFAQTWKAAGKVWRNTRLHEERAEMSCRCVSVLHIARGCLWCSSCTRNTINFAFFPLTHPATIFTIVVLFISSFLCSLLPSYTHTLITLLVHLLTVRPTAEG